MKSFLRTVTVLLLALALNGCSGKATPASGQVLSGIYTTAAMTFEAQATSTSEPATATPITISTSTPSVVPLPSTPTQQSLISSSSSACDSLAYVSDVTISDRTELYPSQTFTKTWLLKNTGTCTWSTSYELTLISGSEMSGSATAIEESVEPGSEVEVSVSLTAPSTAGTYTGYWRLANASGSAFGPSIYVEIIVSTDADTLTPATTSTLTATSTTLSSTNTPAPTSASTSTAIKSATSTLTAIPTSTSASTSTPAPTGTSAFTNTPYPTNTPSS